MVGQDRETAAESLAIGFQSCSLAKPFPESHADLRPAASPRQIGQSAVQFIESCCQAPLQQGQLVAVGLHQCQRVGMRRGSCHVVPFPVDVTTRCGQYRSVN